MLRPFSKEVFLKKSFIKILFLLLVLGAIGSFFHFGLGSYLSLESLKANQQSLENYIQENFIVSALTFLLTYIFITALSLPGAALLTLASGALFGVLGGTLLASVASTTGATLAFLGSRFLFRSSVEGKLGDRLRPLEEGLAKEGALYLLTLRLVPVFPFFLVNLLMGLTKMKTSQFFFVSQIGMLPGTFAYVYAGTEISKIDSFKSVLSPQILFAFALLGLLPWISKTIMTIWKQGRYLRKFKKPAKFDYNMIVLGGGSAGLVSAFIAAAVKAKVALIEKHKMGGDCLNTGCVPSKTLLRSAKAMKEASRLGEFGILASNPTLNFKKVMERVREVIRTIEPNDSMERYRGLGVECFSGKAEVLSPYEVQVNGQTLTSKNIVLATGARPSVPEIPGLHDVRFLTSDNIWDLQELPRRFLILGGGPIGCELAQAFRRLGSEVILIERNSRLMMKEDPEVSEFISDKFKKEGLDVRLNHTAIRFSTIDKQKKLICKDSLGNEITIEFDEVLLALGRKANTEGFGLEKLGIELNPSGTIATDEYLRTTRYPNIFACGDVAGPFQFTHAASHQAWFVAVNSLFGRLRKFKVDYRVLPWCTFTDPEVGRVGLNEQEAKEKGVAYQVTRYSLGHLDRALADGEAEGFVKVLTPPGSDRILGVTLVGPHAGEFLAEWVLAMKHGIGMNKILSTIHSYPTLAEANKFAAGVWKKANAPEWVYPWLVKFHAFCRRS